MTVVSMVRKQSDRRGWLWRRGSEREPWTKVFAAIKGSQLSLHRDDKVAQPLEVISLTGASVSEAVIESGKPPGRTSRSINIQIPSQGLEELQSLLPQCGLTFAGDSRLYQLAAPDAGDHTQWLKLLRQADGHSAAPDGYAVEADGAVGNGAIGNRSHRQAKALEPSIPVSTFLCSPATSAGPELLTVLSKTRRGLHDGAQNLGAAREEARKAQFALNSVRRHMREIDLGITHSHRDLGQEEGMASPVEVRDWLEQALLLMHDTDRALEGLQVKDAPLATEWGTFARDTMRKFHAMEEALLLGKYVCQARRDAEEDALEAGRQGEGPRDRVVLMPYNHAATPYRQYRHSRTL